MGKSKNLATGASYVDTSGDTMTGNLLLGSNSIGLGTTSPDEKLHVEGSILVDAFNAGNETGIFFREGFTSSNKYNHSILAYDTDGSPDGISINGYGGVSICTGSNSRQERFKVDNSGRVTKPNQPSFHAYMSQSNPNITGLNVKIPYSATRWNVGSHFDTTNSRFVAPIAGKYCFQVNHNVYGLSDDQYFRTRVYVNGSSYQILGYMRARGSGDHTTNDSFLLNMSANDYVEIYTNSADSSYHLSATSGWNSFSGFLIG